MRRSLVVLTVLLAAGTAAEPVWAQSAPSTGKPNHNTYGSPLDTIMSTHLWTDVAPAQDFVRESRPQAKSLDYAPLVGTDPDRPKPRDKANIAALQAELEHDRISNEARGRGLPGGPAKVSAKRSAAKAAAKVRHAAVKPAE